MTKYEIFHQLHYKDNPLLIGNAWNAHSAQLLEENGIGAIATSSAAVAISLGYEDGEKISFEELLWIVQKIVAKVNVPVSVDLEGGYGNTVAAIVVNIEKLNQAGVVGINLEDSAFVNGKQQIVPADIFSKKISDIKTDLLKKNIEIFINARTDAFLLKLSSPLETTLDRIKSYQNAGADGIFVPFVYEEESIKKITAASSLPVNVVSMPGLPSFQKLSEWGVRRISMGSSLFRAGYKNIDLLIKNILDQQSFSGLF